MNIAEAFHNLAVEIHERQEKASEQAHIDLSYITHVRSGNYHDGKGVTPDVVAKAQEILARRMEES